MNINEACYHLANGKTLKVSNKKIRLSGGFYQYYCEISDKWLFMEQNGIVQYANEEWELT